MKNNKLIVVLGMHRGGTSAIVRGLEVLGVHLGDNLLSAQLDNPTGFWEDRDVLRLNEELLRPLGSAYDRLGLVDGARCIDPAFGAIRLKAVDFIRKKCDEHVLWGFKDPRTVRLLPFWQSVFVQAGVDVSYVIAVRNPLSVIESLRKRNGFEPEKSIYLWLEHLVPAISRTQGSKRVVVDYDRLLEDAGAELKRVSRALGLPEPAPAALAVYENEFLQEGLRHTVFNASALGDYPFVPPQVIICYDWLVKLAQDNVPVDSPEVAQAFDALSQELVALSPALNLMARQDQQTLALSKAVMDRDGQIVLRDQAVAKLDEQIVDLGQVLAERDGQILRMNQAIVTGHEKIASLGRRVAERDGQIDHLNQAVTTRDVQIVSLNKTVAKLEQTVAERNEWVRALREELLGVYRSVAWNVALMFDRWVPGWVLGVVAEGCRVLGLSFSDERCIKRSGLFDAAWYLAKYPDVASLTINPLAHYLKWGGFEGRSPGPDFDSAWYLQEYPDVAQEGMNPLVHYLRRGKEEGRRPLPFAVLSSGGKVPGFVKRVPAMILGTRRKNKDLRGRQARAKEVYAHDLGDEYLKVSVLISTHGNLTDVEKCLRSILKYTVQAAVEILLINSNPAKKKDLYEWVKNKKELLECFRCKIFDSSESCSFGASINFLADQAKGAYLYLLGDKTEIGSFSWVDALVQAIHVDKTIGAVGSLLLFPQSNLVCHAGSYPVLREDGKVGEGGFYRYFNRHYPDVNRPREVPILTGAALFISSQLFLKIGKWDEAYLGDGGFDGSDLSHRLTEQGYKLLCVPRSVVFYEGGGAHACRKQTLADQRYYSQKWSAFLRRRYSL